MMMMMMMMKPTGRPSDRATQLKLETKKYVLEKIDPVIDKCMTHILCYQPDNIPSAMADFFLCLTNGKAPSSTWGPEESSTKTRIDNEVLSKTLQSIISKLMTRMCKDYAKMGKIEDIGGYFNNVLIEMMETGEIETL